RDADSREGIARYLARNPGLSFVAVQHGRIVGTVMAGHDGKRGYLQHLLVLEALRNRGIGRALVSRSLEGLKRDGILKSHLMILVDNQPGRSFWSRLGWQQRDDVHLFSYINAEQDNA